MTQVFVVLGKIRHCVVFLLLFGWILPTHEAQAQAALSSAANQTFTVGDAATLISPITITDDAVTPTIKKKKDIRIRIPTGFNMTWDASITTVTITGGAAGKVSTTLKAYEDGNKTVVLDVTEDFAAGGDQIIVSDLKFANFGAPSAADNLDLDIDNDAVADATDDKTITIVAAAVVSLSSAADQAFNVDAAATAISQITVSDASTPVITAANDIRIRIPSSFNMTWQTGDLTATIGGTASGKVSPTVSYEDGGQTLVLAVSSDFVNGDYITVSDLSFDSFSAVSAADNLELDTDNNGTAEATDDKTITVVDRYGLSAAANQSFAVGDAATLISPITITDDAVTPTIKKKKDLRIRIPTGFNMTWDASITTVTITGGAAGKVSTTLKAYEDGNKTVVIDVTEDFATGGDQIIVSDLKFANFGAPSAADNLDLDIDNDAVADATDDKTITIVAAAVVSLSSAADQAFNVDAAATAISQITVSDASTPVITAANDIRIRIPSSFNMTWQTGDLTATIGGTASGKVSTTVSYEDGGQTLVLAVSSDFVNGDYITVSDLSFDSFSAVSAADNLELDTDNNGTAEATDDKTVTVINRYGISSAANQGFTVGDAATLISPITITDDAVTPTIKKKKDIRIRIPTGFNMTWDASITTVTITGGAAGKVSTTLKAYEDGNKTVVLDVTGDFAAGGDQIVVSDLKFDNFSANSPLDSLGLDVDDNAVADAYDDKTIEIQDFAVAVTPDTTAASRLPSNGTNYTVAFTVVNTGSGSDGYDLLTTRSPDTALTVVSITGTGVTQDADPDSARVASVAAGDSVIVTVTYSVADIAAGTTDTLFFTARSATHPATTDDGRLELTVVRPNLTTVKAVNPNGTQVPGTDLTYTVTITNDGNDDAAGVVIVDSLAVEVDFKVSSVVNNLPPAITVVVEYSSDGASTWTYTPVSAGCSAPASYDGCVTHIRWTLQNDLSYVGPDNTGNVEFIARIQ